MVRQVASRPCDLGQLVLLSQRRLLSLLSHHGAQWRRRVRRGHQQRRRTLARPRLGHPRLGQAAHCGAAARPSSAATATSITRSKDWSRRRPDWLFKSMPRTVLLSDITTRTTACTRRSRPGCRSKRTTGTTWPPTATAGLCCIDEVRVSDVVQPRGSSSSQPRSRKEGKMES